MSHSCGVFNIAVVILTLDERLIINTGAWLPAPQSMRSCDYFRMHVCPGVYTCRQTVHRLTRIKNLLQQHLTNNPNTHTRIWSQRSCSEKIHSMQSNVRHLRTVKSTPTQPQDEWHSRKRTVFREAVLIWLLECAKNSACDFLPTLKCGYIIHSITWFKMYFMKSCNVKRSTLCLALEYIENT